MRKAWKEKNLGTAKLFESQAWDKLQLRTVNGGYPETKRKSVKDGIRLEMTREEFSKWVNKMRSVIEGLYRAGEKPVLKRIDETKNYSLENILIGTTKVRGSLVQPENFLYEYKITYETKTSADGSNAELSVSPTYEDQAFDEKMNFNLEPPIPTPPKAPESFWQRLCRFFGGK